MWGFRIDAICPKGSPDRQNKLEELLNLVSDYRILLKSDAGRQFMPNNKKRKEEFLMINEVMKHCMGALMIEFPDRVKEMFDELFAKTKQLKEQTV